MPSIIAIETMPFIVVGETMPSAIAIEAMPSIIAGETVPSIVIGETMPSHHPCSPHAPVPTSSYPCVLMTMHVGAHVSLVPKNVSVEQMKVFF